MPTYLYFGEDEFFLNRTIKQLKTHTLDQQWANFNYTEYPPESKETIPQALCDIMTPPVVSTGTGISSHSPMANPSINTASSYFS
ncbi:hypothetical protein [Anabaena sp. UHCC 0253]|uniref:hypothetical protein n=1 Tax=Anabaena sp. UHCC 0253 TaxID=2590019 RepID=UPI0020C2A139|nr:hypothetical protein [Anabaena sp. UHCC 0253]